MALLRSNRCLGRLLVAGLLLVCGEQAMAQRETLESLRKQATQLYQIGKSAEALPLAQRVLLILEERFGPSSADVGAALNTLGLIYYSLGRYADAEPTFRRAIAIAESTSGANNWTMGARLNNLGMTLTGQGRYDESEAVYKQTLFIAESVFGPNDAEVARALTNSAVALSKQGRLADAEAFCKRALIIRESVLGPKHPDVAHTLNSLALVYSDQGRYADAEPLARRALAIEEAAFGPSHPNLVSRLNNLADIYRLEGRYGDAEALYARAIAVAEQSGNDNFVRSILNNLAWLYWVQGRYGEAEPLYLRSLSIAERLLGADHPDLLTHLHNFAALHRVQGRTSDAETLLKRALTIGEKAGGNHPHFAKALNNLALVYQEQGRYPEAQDLFERALATADKALGADHPDSGAYLGNLGTLQAVQDNWAAAATLLKRSASIAIAQSKRTGSALGRPPTGAAATEAERPGDKLTLLVKVLARLPSQSDGRKMVAPGMYEAGQWARGSQAATSIGQMAARQAKKDTLLAGIVRERQDLWSEWQSRDKLLIAAVSRPPENRNGSAETTLRDRLAAIDRRIAEIDLTLAREFPEYAALSSPEPLSIEGTQAQLGADEALVLILDTPEMRPLPEETFIWVVTKTDMRWARSELGTTALSREVAALRCGLDGSTWQGEGAERCAKAVGIPFDQAPVSDQLLPFDHGRAHKLYAALFGEVRDIIKGKQLLIVPSGPLTRLPFQVLVTEVPQTSKQTGGEHKAARWFAREHAITVLPAVSSLKSLRQVSKSSAATLPMIGFGNPLLDGDQTHPQFGAVYKKLATEARDRKGCAQTVTQRKASLRGLSRSLAPLPQVSGLVSTAEVRQQTPLPETADELCDVARDLKADFSEIRLGARATEREIKSLSASGKLAQFHFLHFATHGTLAGQMSGASEPGLILTPPDKGTEEDDGYLSGSEIAGLKLDADWVILSACNTAGGTAEGTGAEALSGLASTFFYAGARALLVSHWEVDSAATVKLITSAVRTISEGQTVGRAEALRRAMLAMIDNGQPHEAHPAYWAPFVVVGEGAAGR
jgi:CHAT domain-containing protein/tetratricopeptide (TPR) repeat protein